MNNVNSSISSSSPPPPKTTTSHAMKKPLLTPKSIIHQKFGTKACFTIKEVEEQPDNGCPGLSLPQKGPSLFICHLKIEGLEFDVVSPPCNRKKEAEQSASLLALQKLGIDPQKGSSTISDAEDELVARLSFIFSTEFLSSLHPLSSHLKALLSRENEHNGVLPISTLIACDAKLGNLCKSVNPSVESNPSLSIPLILKAAGRLSDLIVISEQELWIRRQKPYPADVIASIANQQSLVENVASSEAVYIPSSYSNDVSVVCLQLGSNGYYLDAIAQQLSVMDASKVLISRTIGKASSEMRLYFSALETNNLKLVSGAHEKELLYSDCSFNVRASYLLGQPVYGNAVLASIGYTWRGVELFIEDVTLRTYFRMLVGKTPCGLYKLSREAMLMANLPTSFTTRPNWRGSLPRDLLFTFCRQYRLAEPDFNVVCNMLESDQGSTISSKKPAENGTASAPGQNLSGTETFKCEVQVLSKNQGMILKCSPKECFKKQGDAVQNASLRVLSWLNSYFEHLDIPSEKLSLCDIDCDIQCQRSYLMKELFLCQTIHNILQTSDTVTRQKLNSNEADARNEMSDHESQHLSAVLECSSKECFKKPENGVQNASSRGFSWLNSSFKHLDILLEKLSLCGIGRDIQCQPSCLLREFFLCQTIHHILHSTDTLTGKKLNMNKADLQSEMSDHEDQHLSIEGAPCGSLPFNGSLVCIKYSVTLVSEEKQTLEMIEENDEFEFEIGTGAVIPSIEAAVLQMTAGQSACLYMNLPSQELVFAAALDPQKVCPHLSSRACSLKYSVTLLQITAPFEERVEQALFSPPLSKQRVEYALQCIKNISAASLIDFGCGSGSLLDSLLDTPTSLEKIVGVDISQKGLIRAAKILNTKLEKSKTMATSRIKSTVLYEGSITVFDSRLYGFDIGTCLEVIEHMEEDQACLFGDIALGLFCPKILIVSTPNYEYNVILQGSNLEVQEDDPDDKAQAHVCKFRNHDHKFEWTRKQFCDWANDLALRYNYKVEFGGVGGVSGVEPGFASQIAVFRSDSDEHHSVKDCGDFMEMEGQRQYKTIWEWNAAPSTVSKLD